MKETHREPIDECIARREETVDLLSRPDWVDTIRRGKAEVAGGVAGKSLRELKD